MILNEAAERYDFTPAWKNIKALKVGRTEVDPFSLEEVERFLKHVDGEYHAYYVTNTNYLASVHSFAEFGNKADHKLYSGAIQ